MTEETEKRFIKIHIVEETETKIAFMVEEQTHVAGRFAVDFEAGSTLDEYHSKYGVTLRLIVQNIETILAICTFEELVSNMTSIQ